MEVKRKGNRMTIKNIENCFKSRPKINPGQNQEALELAIDGIELFEVPTADLGTPLEMLQEIKYRADILAYFVGLGKLIKTGSITWNKREISYDDLFTEEPHQIVSGVVGYGYKYNAICEMKRKSPKRFKRGELQKQMLSLFEDETVKKRFMHSLREARKTQYYQNRNIPPPESVNNLRYIENLVGEMYAAKRSEEFLWHREDGRTGRRMKTRSSSKGREGSLYFTWNVGDNYTCTCPTHSLKECKHIKEMKLYQKQ